MRRNIKNRVNIILHIRDKPHKTRKNIFLFCFSCYKSKIFYLNSCDTQNKYIWFSFFLNISMSYERERDKEREAGKEKPNVECFLYLFERFGIRVRTRLFQIIFL